MDERELAARECDGRADDAERVAVRADEAGEADRAIMLRERAQVWRQRASGYRAAVTAAAAERAAEEV